MSKKKITRRSTEAMISKRAKLLETGLINENKYGYVGALMPFKHNEDCGLLVTFDLKINYYVRFDDKIWNPASFQEIFNDAPREVQEKMIYHLDLLKG